VIEITQKEIDQYRQAYQKDFFKLRDVTASYPRKESFADMKYVNTRFNENHISCGVPAPVSANMYVYKCECGYFDADHFEQNKCAKCTQLVNNQYLSDEWMIAALCDKYKHNRYLKREIIVENKALQFKEQLRLF